MAHSRAPRPDLPHRLEVRVSDEHLTLLDSVELPTRSDAVRWLIERHLKSTEQGAIELAPTPNPG